MILDWFKITTTNSIIRGNNFFFKIKPDTFLPQRPRKRSQTPSHPSSHSTDDHIKEPVNFSWQLLLYVKKYYGLLNIAFWLAKNLWTRKCNRQVGHRVFCLKRQVSLFAALTWNPLELGDSFLHNTQLHFN